MDSLIETYYKYADVLMLFSLSLTCRTFNTLTRKYLQKYKDNYIFLRKLSSIPIKQNIFSKWCRPENILEYELNEFVSVLGNQMNTIKMTLYFYYFIKKISTHGKTIEFGKDYNIFLVYKDNNYIRQLPSTSGYLDIQGINTDIRQIEFNMTYEYIEGHIFYKSVITKINSSPFLWLAEEFDLGIDKELFLKIVNYRGSIMNVIYFI